MNTRINFKTARTSENLQPWQITGFVDGEGSFICTIVKNSNKVSLEFKVTQKSHSEGILQEFKEYFKSGSVVIDNRKTSTSKFHITSLAYILDKVIPHFDAYPCLTSKDLNYRDWKAIALLMKDKKTSNTRRLIGNKKFSIKN